MRNTHSVNPIAVGYLPIENIKDLLASTIGNKEQKKTVSSILKMIGRAEKIKMECQIEIVPEEQKAYSSTLSKQLDG